MSWFSRAKRNPSLPEASNLSTLDSANAQLFKTEINGEVLITAWKTFVQIAVRPCQPNTDEWLEKLRYFLQLYRPNYNSWHAPDVLAEIDETRAASLPRLSRDVLDRFTTKISFARQAFELRDFTIDALYSCGILDNLFLLFVLSSAQQNRVEFLTTQILSVLAIVIANATNRLVLLLSTNDTLRNAILLVISYSWCCVRNFLPSVAVTVPAALDKFDTDFPSLRRKELLMSAANLVKVCKVQRVTVELFKTLITGLGACEKILANSRVAQEAIVDSKIMNDMAALFGWPEVSALTLAVPGHQSFLGLQLSALKLLAEAFSLPQNVHRWSSVGGFLKLMDSILWASYSFKISESTNTYPAVASRSGLIRGVSVKSLASGAATPQQWLISNRSLHAIFEALLRMCTTPGTESLLSDAVAGGKNGIHETLLALFSDLFNLEIRQTKFNTLSRIHLKRVPELQLFILRYLVQLALEQPRVLHLFEPCRIYDLLMGPFFLGLIKDKYKPVAKAAQSAVAAAAEIPGEPAMPRDPSALSPEEEEAAYNYQIGELERYWFETVSYLGTSENSTNVLQCRLLLRLIDEYFTDGMFGLCLRASTALLRILEAKSITTSQALVQLTAMPRFAKLVDLFRSKIAGETDVTRRAEMTRARNGLMRCLDSMLSTTALLRAAFGDLTTIDSLFNMLLDTETRSFAMSHIIHIMKADGLYVEANFDQFFKLYERYLDTLLRVPGDSANFDLELMLLHGISAILEIKDKKEHQAMFREAEAFLKLTSLINIIEKTCLQNDKPLNEVCLAVLKALTSLMANNDENKEHFKSHIGYDQLKELILHAFNKTLSDQVLSALFDLLLDGSFSQAKTLDGKNTPTDELVGNSSGTIIEPSSVLENTTRSFAVRNPNIAVLMLKLMPYFQLPEQLTLFDTLILVMKDSSINRSKFCSERVLFHLLKMAKTLHSSPPLEERLCVLIKLLAEHSITVRELTKMISLMKPRPGDLKPPWMAKILEILLGMSYSEQSPFPIYFDFDGNKAALALQDPLPLWPIGRARFTFAAWVNIESFDDPCGAPNYQPRLFSFLDDSGQGMEVYFKHRRLNFQTIVQGRKGERKAFAYEFPTKTWLYIAITYSTTGFATSRADLKLYIDSQLKGRESLSRPVAFKNLTNCRIGCNADVISKDAEDPIMRQNSLYGQMTDVVILDNELDPLHIDDLKNRQDSPESLSQRGEWANMFDGPTGIQARVIMCYHPRATASVSSPTSGVQEITPYTSKNMCFDTSPFARDAILASGLNIVHRKHLKEILVCISGGLKALLPLYLLLDKPESPLDLSPTSPLSKSQFIMSADPGSPAPAANKYATSGNLGRFATPDKNFRPLVHAASTPLMLASAAVLASDSPLEDLDEDLDEMAAKLEKVEDTAEIPLGVDPLEVGSPKLADQITQLLCKTLSSSRELQQELRSCGGFELVAYILLKISPHNLSKELLQSLTQTLQGKGLHGSMEDDLILNVLMDFHLWIYTKYTVQKYLLEVVLPTVLSPRKHLRYRYGSLVTRLLESMRMFYWSVEGGKGEIMATEPIVHPATKRIIAQRPTATHLRMLRYYILDLIGQVVAPDISLEETRELLQYLLDCKDPEQYVDCLKFIRRLMQLNNTFLTHLKSFGREFFLIPLEFRSSRVRCLSLGLLNTIVLLPTPASAANPSGGVNEWTDGMLLAVQTSLTNFKIDISTYNSLFAICVGQVEGPSWDPSNKINVDDTTKILWPNVLPVMLRLAQAGGAMFVQQLLQDIALLVTLREDNAEKFSANFGWPLWLLGCLGVGEDEDTKRVLFELTMNIFKAVVAYRLSTRGGHSVLGEIEIFVKIHSETDAANATLFWRGFLQTLVSTLRRDLTILKKRQEMERVYVMKDLSKTSPLLTNIAQVVFYYTEFIYYMDVTDPQLQELRKDALTSQWAMSDEDVAIDLLEVVGLFENLELGKDLTVSTATSANSLKKGVFRTSGSVPLALKLAVSLYATLRDEEKVKECVAICEVRLTSKSAKVDEVHFFLFHVLQALYHHKSSVGWCATLQSFTVSIIHRLFKFFKPEYASFKKLDANQMQYLDSIREGTQIDFASPLFSEVMATLRSKLTSAESDDLTAQDQVPKGQVKNLRAAQSKYRKMKEVETDTQRKISDSRTQLKASLASKVSAITRPLSNQILTDKYAKVARKWRNILRALKSERGPWGTRQTLVHWKLNPYENHLRMRLKMTRNYNFNDHTDAIRRPAKAKSLEDLTDVAPLPTLPSLLRTNVNKDFLLELMGTDNDTGRPDLTKFEDDDLPSTSSATGESVEKPVHSVYCELIRPMKVIKGVLEITATQLHFKETRAEGNAERGDAPLKEKFWPLDQIREIHFRRYLLMQSALEIFLTDQRNYFVNFNKKERDRIYTKIIRMNPPRLIYHSTRSPEEILETSGLTKKWQNRQISNFEYLMHLNTIAGRTYNDLCQYPVFPWVLTDYTSEKIDLGDPKVYRDLSKPVGALNAERLKQFEERMASWVDGMNEGPPFLYGSHYSSAATVLFYLIRMEPFTTHAIHLQGGKFDIADRLFYSIPQCWANCLVSTSDVKELVPEFFYQPEFLENKNKFFFGKRQTGQPIEDVQLPPWAATPEEFIRINRLALESEYVSMHLHEWIDLIFGFKQRGVEAKKAHNVFHYLTYEGSVDIESITDPMKRQATELTIAEFGQTPSQLLRRPHPQRNPEVIPKELPLDNNVLECPVAESRIVWLACRKTDVVCLEQKGHIKFVQIPALLDQNTPQTPPGSPQGSQTRPPNAPAPLTSSASQTSPGLATISALADENAARLMLPHLSTYQTFALSRDGFLLFSSHREDNCLKSTVLESFKPIQSLKGHQDTVTCLAITDDGLTIVTGSKDTTLLVWNVSLKNYVYLLDDLPKFSLNGHNDEVLSVALSADLDICVSGSKDSSIIIHTLSSGEYVRSIQLPAGGAIDNLALSTLGFILAYSKFEVSLQLFSLNGKKIRYVDAHEHIVQMVTTRDGEYVITAGKKLWIFVRSVFELKVLFKYPVPATAWSLTLSPDEKFILVGLEDGKVCVLPLDLNSLPKIAHGVQSVARPRAPSTSAHI